MDGWRRWRRKGRPRGRPGSGLITRGQTYSGIVEEERQARLRADNQRADLLRYSGGVKAGQAQG